MLSSLLESMALDHMKLDCDQEVDLGLRDSISLKYFKIDFCKILIGYSQ